MTAEQLRNSILQEAISGRLVPQDPNDEPASVLLQHIREERESLVAKKELKKADLIISEIDNDVVFDIPNGWEWVTIDQIAIVKGGKRLPVGKTFSLEPTPYMYIRVTEMKNNTLIDCDHKYISKELRDFLSRYTISSADIYVTIAGTIGAVGDVPEKFDGMNLTENALKLSYLRVDKKYLIYALSSPLVQSQFKDKTNKVGQPKLAMERVKNSCFPLPPLAEQKRIVAKLEELLPIVDQYGKAQTELDQLNAALPARLRQSILQQAISGRLVPQDENETANGLKEQLLQAVNNSLLKKKWKSEPIEDDELPFDIPENWKWIRLGDIVYTQTGLSYSKGDLEKKVPNPIRVLRGGNIQNGSWCTKDDDVMIAPEFVKKDIFLKKNSFITPAVTSLEHLGKTALIREDHNDIVAGGFVLYLMPYNDKNNALMEYLAYFFQSAFYNSFCKTITHKSGQAFWNISREKLLQLTIPLPPLAEQQRIVAKIEELFEQIDKIRK